MQRWIPDFLQPRTAVENAESFEKAWGDTPIPARSTPGICRICRSPMKPSETVFHSTCEPYLPGYSSRDNFINAQGEFDPELVYNWARRNREIALKLKPEAD